MQTNLPIVISVASVQRAWVSIGLRDYVLQIHILDACRGSKIELRQRDLKFLHESLVLENGGRTEDVPNYPDGLFTIIETSDHEERVRLKFEGYLQSLVTCSSCVVHDILWVTLGLGSVSSVIPRFLLKRDNIIQLDELSSKAVEAHRLVIPGLIGSILRFLNERQNSTAHISLGVSVLSRIISNQPSCAQLIGESDMLTSLLEMLQLPSSCPLIKFVPDLLYQLVETQSGVLFSYFQKSRGLFKLCEIVDGLPAPAAPHSLTLMYTVSQMVLIGLLKSTDICISVSEKDSSFGMTLFNKLLVRGECTVVEVVTAGSLCYLAKFGYLDEHFRSKITRVIFSILDRMNVFLLDRSMGPFPYKLIPVFLGGNGDSIVAKFRTIAPNESAVMFACFLIIHKYLLSNPPTSVESVAEYNQIISLIQLSVEHAVYPSRGLNSLTEAAIVSACSPDRSHFLVEHIPWDFFVQQLNSIATTLMELNLKVSSIDLGVSLSEVRLTGDRISTLTPHLLKPTRELADAKGEVEHSQKRLLDKIVSLMDQTRELHDILDRSRRTVHSTDCFETVLAVQGVVRTTRTLNWVSLVREIEEQENSIGRVNELQRSIVDELHRVVALLQESIKILGNVDEEGYEAPELPLDD